MPLPAETQGEFLLRCMADDESVAEFPDSAQRLVVCNSLGVERTDAAAGDDCS